ncbi:hypothetical protein [Microbulbifer guangxiensis]|uniref:hypothetical protein n=1 Tax=Microbulbifer guangxiensis TaxID=2904249 RepID=UPI001F1E4267|nr:hypothetical protein [Microbulbifer guangxiensis]
MKFEIPVRKLFPLVCFMVAGLCQAQSLDDLYHSLPILICHDDRYLSCQKGASAEECTLQAKVYRDSCLADKEISDRESFGDAMQCLLFKHNGVSSFEEFEDNCNGGMNINLSKSKERIRNELTPSQIEQLLE